jgi:hypothetical protein
MFEKTTYNRIVKFNKSPLITVNLKEKNYEGVKNRISNRVASVCPDSCRMPGRIQQRQLFGRQFRLGAKRNGVVETGRRADLPE